MQQIQPAVLDPITLGKTPLFIIAPHTQNGGAIAALLSNYFRIKDMLEFAGSIAGYEHSYFNNSEVSRILVNAKEQSFAKPKDTAATLKFLLEIGFDNNKLWGLLCDYEAFFELQLRDLFPGSFFAFVYTEGFATDPSAKKVLDFLAANPKNAFSLPSDSAAIMPKLLLSSLPIANPTLIIREPPETSAVITPVTPTGDGSADEKLQKVKSYNLLSKSNLWFGGKDILYILYANNISFSEELLAEKLAHLRATFSENPQVVVVARSESEKEKVDEIIAKRFHHLVSNVIDTSASSINHLIQKAPGSYILIDELGYSYPLIDILSPFKDSQPPTVAFAAPLPAKFERLSLEDLLMRVMGIDTLTFQKQTLFASGGFDLSLTPHEMFWDMAVKSMQAMGGYAYALNTAQKAGKRDIAVLKNEQFFVTQPENFDKLSERYEGIFVKNIKQILLRIFNEHRFLEFQQNEANRKIANQQQLIGQTQDQIRAVTELNMSMQQRIAFLESKWYYKFEQKLKHFKGIFFKKSTAGTSSFKKFLKFIAFTFSKPGFKVFRKIVKGIMKRLYLLTEDRPVNIIYLDTSEGNIVQQDYNEWIQKKLNPRTLQEEYASGIDTLKIKPKISVIMPVYNPHLHFLREAIESVLSQSYTNWEFCIADDCSPNPQIQRMLHAYAMKDSRIKIELREENGHISAASNSALAMVTGDWVLLLDHDDLLTSNCMFELVKHMNEHPDDELIYSDEDKMVESNVFADPFFKPDWSPDKLMATNYISHVVIIKKRLLDIVGGFRLGFEGSQDYDLMLRCTEKAKGIGHVPKILYHWRIHELSVAGNTDVKPYAYIAGKKALEEALMRREQPAEVQYTPQRGRYRIKYHIRRPGKVSILIPTKDAAAMMKNTIDSIIELTEYPDYEIIVLNNNSTTKEFFDLMKYYEEKHGDIFRCIEASFPFNFSKLMNMGAAMATGEYILMLNNDVEILKGDWITWMVAYAQNEWTGAVGVKLLYPDDRIQHAGTVIGLGDDKIAAHAFVGYHKDMPGYFNKLQFVSNYAALTAACLMIRKSVYDEVGGMDEALEVEYNDVDFCLKLIDKGYYNVYLPDVVLYHYESATRGHPHQDKKSYERHVREIAYFRSKWKKYIKKDPFYNPNLSLDGAGFTIDYNS